MVGIITGSGKQHPAKLLPTFTYDVITSSPLYKIPQPHMTPCLNLFWDQNDHITLFKTKFIERNSDELFMFIFSPTAKFI